MRHKIVGKQKIVVGLAGPARSGKDTTADWFVRVWGFYKYSLASPIKVALRAGLGLTASHTDGDLKEEPLPGIGKSPRQLMQTLGTEWGRQMIHPDIWLTMAQRRNGYEPFMVVPDVRFPNEAEWVRQNGILVHIRRPGATSVSEHASEDGIKPIEGEVVVLNNRTVEDLHTTLFELFGTPYYED